MKTTAKEILTSSAEETIRYGRDIATQLQAPILVLLSGDLGAGKTTLAKGIISGLNAAREEDVTSPTFTLVHEFHCSFPVYHVDLYRISGFSDLESLGLEDIFLSPAVVIVEWPDRFRMKSDWPVLRIEMAIDREDRRLIRSSRDQ
jgi:tRNA threonylcarbamoyladenosine biosynthesis protein TsaE